VPGAQIGHCGPKAARQKPWDGLRPLGPEDAARGEPPWTPVASTSEPSAEGYHVPEALSLAEIARVVDAFGQGARRCAEAGFDVLDIHAAHGYLIHTFLSPIANKRADAYGGDLRGRMRFALEIAEAIRAHWPADKPVLFRLSCIDRIDFGWEMADTLTLAAELRIDAIDCSSGGIRGANSLAVFDRIGGPPPGYQVPFAAEIRTKLGMPTMAVGLITDPRHAERILADGQADLIAVAREALYDPNWPLHAAIALAGRQDNQRQFGYWPPNYGWWLQYREKQQARRGTASAG
jgi:2,4-dienoyl-CoA reductase-like NADH-dependent reductase (Old Yellow Enzyme family)